MKITRTVLIATVLIIIFASVSLAAVPVKVPVGKGLVITLKEPSKRLSMASSDIAEVNLITPKEILVNGKKEGTTNLIVWDEQGQREFFDIIVYRERVVTHEKETIEALDAEIKSLAPGAAITVEQIGDTLVLTGTAKNRITVDKIEKVALLYAPKACKGISRDYALESSQPKTKDERQTEIRGGGAYGGIINVTAPERTFREEKTEGPRESLCVLNLVSIPEPQQVLLEVKVAQVDKNVLNKIGVSFLVKGKSAEGFSNIIGAPTSGSTLSSSSNTGSSTTSSSAAGTGIAGSIAGLGSFNPLDMYQLGAAYFAGGIGAVLQALATKDLAKVLAEPNLLVRSGQEGTFLAGSRIPISVVTSAGGIAATEIQFIDVGVKLKFKPNVMENGMIALKIDPASVSNVTGVLAVNGYPVIDTREVTTDVELKEGESLVLAGLLIEESVKTMSKIPLLGDIPILGALFRSTQDDLKQKELVFFITPKIIKPMAAGTKTELPTDKPVSPELEKDLKWIPGVK